MEAQHNDKRARIMTRVLSREELVSSGTQTPMPFYIFLRPRPFGQSGVAPQEEEIKIQSDGVQKASIPSWWVPQGGAPGGPFKPLVFS